VNAHCLRYPPVRRQNLITIDIVDFLQPSATLYWYEGITILVTEHPTADWTAQQIIEAFPEETAPRFLFRDRDQIYGEEFSRRVAGRRIEEVITAPHSPRQSPYVERLIGSIRRERLNHVIVFNETQLRRILKSYIAYYYRSRTHLSLAKGSPMPRGKQPPDFGAAIEVAEVGGLHQRYEQRAT